MLELQDQLDRQAHEVTLVQLEIQGNREIQVQLDPLDKEEIPDKEETLVLLAIRELLDLKVQLEYKVHRDRMGLLVQLATLEELGQLDQREPLVLPEMMHFNLQEVMMDQ